MGRKGTVRQPAPIPIRSERSSSDQQPLPSASLAAAATEIAAYPAPAAESIDGPKTAPDDPATGQGGDGIAPAFSIGTSGNPPPVYPLAARRQGLEGRVLLRVRVAPNGTPADVTMLETSGHAILDGAASDALARWRFEPARRLGLPISGTVDVPIVFRLRGYTKGLGY